LHKRTKLIKGGEKAGPLKFIRLVSTMEGVGRGVARATGKEARSLSYRTASRSPRGKISRVKEEKRQNRNLLEYILLGGEKKRNKQRGSKKKI